MNPERWHRIEELFLTVADHPLGEREAYLTRLCAGDEALRGEVLKLLARDTVDDFLAEQIGDAAATFTADELHGVRIGPYRLTQLIGRGGMGAVYEAKRDDAQFEQKVAIKLIKRGMDSDFVRERFLRERRILAALDHPYIARLFDGGTTADGQPYFVMEFVDGLPITEYCRQQKLALKQTLALFRQVCAAVQHAHQKLVVHRDLKPSNILITADGAQKLPKLLDFGIAKLLSPDPEDADTRTETALRLMTPDYASPEQIHGAAITTASDVYSLGVVLYELLTGRRPYQFDTYTPLALESALCETIVARPSEVAVKHGRQLAGDLDNIVLMALRKEPERRYRSVEQFSEDIHRYLDDLPVTARTDTFGYRLDKFMRRHKTGVAVLALLALLAVSTGVQALRIARERDRANQQAATAQAVTQSLVEMFAVADPSKTRGNIITAKELLDQGAERVVRELKDQPVVQAKLLDTLGQLYQNIALYEHAQPLLEEALRLRRQTLGAAHADVATSLGHLAEATRNKGDYARGEVLFREALALRRKLLGKEHADVAESLNNLGEMLGEKGEDSEAEALIREALAMRRRLLGETHADVANSMNALGRLLNERGKFKEAEAQFQQALTLRRKLFGAEHPLVASSLDQLATNLLDQGDLKGAEALFREALALNRKLLGEGNPDVTVTLAMLAYVLKNQGRYDEAELMLRRELEQSLHFNQAYSRLITLNNLANVLREKGSYAEAETLNREALELRRQILGESHASVGLSLHDFSILLYLEGKYKEAEQTERQALDILLKTYTPEHYRLHRSRGQLGACLTKLKRYGEAEALLLPAYAGMNATRGEQHLETQKLASHLIELYEAWSKPKQADTYRTLPHANSDKATK